ncbi:MAG: class I SAM-dependent methyltransferase [Gammaproteobacteria bacterium]|nr:class I SAM-dependent methyltransferase [Gammaproteobacteria bacterium]MDH3506371.1 class I SAM-dependent methyltransferase [Gammaproteobacteria bacterium]
MLKESGTRSGRGTWHSAPAERNTGPILNVLAGVLPTQGKVLEIASGTGQHVVAFARAFPHLNWQPSDVDADLRTSVELRVSEAALDNIRPPVELDVMRFPWSVDSADAIVCINMIHVAPWPATEALFRGAARLLGPRGILVTYGPYLRGGRHTAPSNEAFDEALRARDVEWGIRDIDVVSDVARVNGFTVEDVIAMPANNFTLVFRSGADAAGADLSV